MSMNWVNALDACASSGVLNYDAAADIVGAPSRFYGNPDMEKINMLPDFTKIKDQPQKDTFNKSSNVNQNPKWKKILFGALIAGGAVALLLLGKGKGKGLGGKLKNIGTTLKNWGGKIWTFIKKPFGFLKKKPAPTP